MDTTEIERLIESTLDDAVATVQPSRHHEDEDHLAVEVVSPTFEGQSLVDRHQLVHDALADHLTEDIHAIEVRTYTPAEADDT